MSFIFLILFELLSTQQANGRKDDPSNHLDVAADYSSSFIVVHPRQVDGCGLQGWSSEVILVDCQYAIEISSKIH
jgi:hypothetical protein